MTPRTANVPPVFVKFVFQGFNLLTRTTALENTQLPTLYTKIDKQERQKRAADALAMVGLAES